MSTYVTADFVKTKQKINDAKFWKVFDQSGKSLIDKCEQDIGLSASIDMLQETLEECMGEFVIVKLYQKQPERRELGINAETGLTLKVKLDKNPGYSQKSNYQSGIGQISLTDYMLINDKNRQLELDKLRMELEADKQETPAMAALYKMMENPVETFKGIGMMIAMATNKAQIAAPESILINEVQSLGIEMSDLQKAIAKFKEDPDSLKTFSDHIKNYANS